MLDRLSPVAVLRGHWYGLRNRARGNASTPDIAVRAVVVGVPFLVAGLARYNGLEMQAPGVLVAGLSLLSAGLLAAFAQIATIRSGFVAPDDPDFDPESETRDMLDESVAHILTAALLSAGTAFTVVVGMNSQASNGGTQLGTSFSTVIAWSGTYLGLLFCMTVRKLYGAYVVANAVSRELSGHYH